jgi:hypothetical protein
VVRARLADGTEIDHTGMYIVWEEYFTRRVLIIREGGSVDVQH